MSSDIYCLHYFSLFILFSSCFCILKTGADEVSNSSIKLGDKCKRNDQCQNFTINSTCSDGVCECESGFFAVHNNINGSICVSNDKDKTDEEYVGSSDPPKIRQQQVDPNMIIIMVVLAVMFIGICVALHLFSKARFRNHRTIFNSPHPRLMHIKLGEKKGRRRASHTSLEVPGSRQMSICSQLSPLQSRRGSQAASPETTNKSRKSNGDKKDTNSQAHKAPKEISEKSAKVASDAAANGPGSPTVIVTNRGSAKGNAPDASARV